MTMRARIKCINKSDRYNPHERITHVGGGPTESQWRQTQEQTIREIEDGSWSYYVEEDRKSADVIVATHNGNKYIKTTADGVQPDNLLSLPECPKK